MLLDRICNNGSSVRRIKMITGSLQTKDNKYYAVLNLKKNGKRHQKWICTGYTVKGNKTKAMAVLEELKREYNLKENLINTETYLSDYIKLYLETKKSDIDEITYQGYHQYAYKHLIPFFENKKLQMCDINVKNLKEYFDHAYKKGRLDGKGGLSPSTLRLHKIFLNQVLNHAICDKILNENPSKQIKLPKQEKRDINFMTKHEIKSFMDDIKDEFIFPLLKILLFYGLRRSELIGLKWKNVDLKSKTFTIASTVVKVEKTITKDRTKNKTSHRSYEMTPEILELFKNLYKEQQTNKKLFGSEYQDSPFVFTWPDGHPVSIDYISHAFKKLLKKYDYKDLRLHDLRHSCASAMLSNGYALKDVQEWLGHTNIDTTADIYGHLDISRKREIASSLTEMFK